MWYNKGNGGALSKRMVKSLEQFVAEATQAYQPATQAVETQLGGLQGQLDTANEQINKNYAQQQATLNRQRNAAASSASMNAAGSGGSFGGATNLANRKYYAQSFVPAQTQMQTNQANELSQARQNYENQRTNLQAQLQNLAATANQQALQQYWNAQEAEKQRQAQARANAAQNAYYQALIDQMRNQGANGTTQSFNDWVANTARDDQIGEMSRANWVKGLNNTAKFNQGISGNLIQNAVANQLKGTTTYNNYLKAIGR